MPSAKGFKDLDEYTKLRIFEYLDAKSLLKCSLVCKEWNQVISGSLRTTIKFELNLTDKWQECFDVIKERKRVFKSVRFSNFIVPMSDEEEIEFTKLLDHISKSVTAVCIKHIQFISSSVFERMINYFSSLKSLKIEKLKVNRTSIGSSNHQSVSLSLENLEVLAGVNEEVFKSLVNLGIQSERITIQCNEKDNVTDSCLFLAGQENLKTLRILGVNTGYYRGNVFKIFQQLSDKNVVFKSLSSLTFAWEKNLHIFHDETNINYFNTFLELQSDNLLELQLSLFHIPESLFQTITKLKIQRLKVTCSILTHQLAETSSKNLELKTLDLSIGEGSSFNSNLDMILTCFPEIEFLGVIVTYEKLQFNSPYVPKIDLVDEQRLKIIADRLQSLKALNLKNLTMTHADVKFHALKTFFFRCQNWSDIVDETNKNHLLNCNESIQNLKIEIFDEVNCDSKSKELALGDLFFAIKNLNNLTEITILVWYSDEFSIKTDDVALELFQKHFKNLQLIKIVYRGESYERSSVMKNLTKNYRIRILEFNNLENSLSDVLSIDRDYLQFRREPIIVNEDKNEFTELRKKRLIGLFNRVQSD